MAYRLLTIRSLISRQKLGCGPGELRVVSGLCQSRVVKVTTTCGIRRVPSWAEILNGHPHHKSVLLLLPKFTYILFNSLNVLYTACRDNYADAGIQLIHFGLSANAPRTQITSLLARPLANPKVRELIKCHAVNYKCSSQLLCTVPKSDESAPNNEIRGSRTLNRLQ